MDLFIIKKPIISEKSTLLRAQNKYLFDVDMKANKFQIKKAIEELFKVKVLQVNTLKLRGKRRRVRWRTGKTSDRKRAIVTLAQGQSIPIFEV